MPALRHPRYELVFLLAVVSAAVLLGVVAAFHNPAYVDEYTYARLGYSLSQGHLASDSSFLSIYRQYGLVTNAIVTPYGYVDSVQPWLDHPPLVGLLQVPLVFLGQNPRILPVILDVGIVISIFWLLRKDDLLTAALAASTFVAFIALFPVLSMLFLDSAVSFFFVMTLALLVHFNRTGSKRVLYLSGVSAGLAVCSKVPGVVAIFLLLLFSAYAISSRKVSHLRAGIPIAIAIIFALVWPLYGFATEPGLFWQLTVNNVSRSVLSGTSPQQILTALIESASFTKPTYFTTVSPLLIISWFAAGVSLIVRRFWWTKIAFGSYVLLLFLLNYAPPQSMIPLYPFFAISVAVAASSGIRLATRLFANAHPNRIRSARS